MVKLNIAQKEDAGYFLKNSGRPSPLFQEVALTCQNRLYTLFLKHSLRGKKSHVQFPSTISSHRILQLPILYR